VKATPGAAMRGRWCRGTLASFILAFVMGSVSHADNIPTISFVRTAELPSLPASGALLGLVTLDGTPIAIQASAAWLLDERKSWTRAEWREAPETIRGFVSDGREAYLLFGPSGLREAQAITRVARLERSGQVLTLRFLPSPPLALGDARGAVRLDTLYLAGADSNGQPKLLTYADGTWSVLESWPGGGYVSSLVFQNSALYVTVGDGRPGAARLFRRSADGSWQDRGAMPAAVVPGAGRPIGQSHILYLLRDTRNGLRFETFHTISSSWAKFDLKTTAANADTTPFGTGLLIAHEAAGGVSFETSEIRSNPRSLQVIDWVIVGVYLGAMLGAGVYFYVRAKKGSTADFFVGSRSIPFWAAGVSIFATNTSSISYVAIPAKAFETDWQYFTGKMVTVVGLMFVAVWIVPVLRRLNLVSVFNYLEMRFNVTIRLLASALCMFMHVGARMSVVLFLPALAIATITGTDVVWSILLMGVCTIVYTTMGGMRAVVWTDFFQVIVLMGGALFAISYVFWSLGGDVIFETARAYEKTHTFNYSLDLTQPTIWGFLLLILFDTVLTFPKDQVLMQRTLATSSDKNAGRSIWVFAAVLLPGGFIFYVIGTVLFAFYKAHPERLDPLLPIDATFPLFIAAELPAGVTGIIIAGIFAAAMGTLSSTINSVATLLSVDFYEKLAKNPTQQRSVRFAEWMSVVVGLVGIGLALLLSLYDIHSLLDLTIELAGVLGGGFAGAYTLGMFTKRANSQGVAIGITCAIIVTLTSWSLRLVHPYFYLAISIMTCIVVGYCTSYLFPAPTRSLSGLTVRLDGSAESRETVPPEARV
jgi:SSS family solute:Na+ symporter